MPLPYVQGHDLRVFLSLLKYDLSPWYLDLSYKGLGTMEQLWMISCWEEDRLDRLLAEIVPTMPEIGRYAFIQGIVGLAQEGFDGAFGVN